MQVKNRTPKGRSVEKQGKNYLQLLRKHIVITITIIAIICAAFIGFAEFQPINLYYSFTFEKSPKENSQVIFAFDSNKDFPSSSLQKTKVTGSQATIHVDPLNNDSKKLQLIIPETGVAIKSFIAHTNVRGQHDHVIYTIDGSELSRTEKNGETVFSLQEKQLSDIEKQSQLRSPLKLVLLMLLFSIYVILVLKNTCFKAVPLPLYAFGAVGAIAVELFLCNLWVTRIGLGVGRYHYRRVITLLLFVFFILIIANYVIGSRCNQLAKRAVAIIDYGAVLIYAIFQFPLFTRYLGGFPDEQAHISYIAFLKYYGGVIPNFADMHIYNNDSAGILMYQPNQFNYLGHPPLYYQIMKLFGGLNIIGDSVTYNLTYLRLLSFCIGLLGIAIIFYIGFTRISPIPLLHLLFAVVVIAPANLIYGLCGISNDSLALLTVSVFTLGIVRFYEKKYNIWTYLLIAVGISTTLLTKLTAGLIVVVMSVLVVGYTLLVDKKASTILCKPFFATAPIYLIPAGYFAALYMKFHTIQPGYPEFAYKEYINSHMYVPNDDRQVMAITEYVQYFFTRFLGTWYSISGHVEVPRNGIKPFDISTIGMLLILLVPLTVFLYARSKAQRFLSMGTCSVLVVILYQFNSASKGFYNNGYLGGIQSRYYLCAIGFFALALIWMVSHLVVHNSAGDLCYKNPQIENADIPRLSSIGTLVCISLSTLLLCENLASFLYQADAISGFIQ